MRVRNFAFSQFCRSDLCCPLKPYYSHTRQPEKLRGGASKIVILSREITGGQVDRQFAAHGGNIMVSGKCHAVACARKDGRTDGQTDRCSKCQSPPLKTARRTSERNIRTACPAATPRRISSSAAAPMSVFIIARPG